MLFRERLDTLSRGEIAGLIVVLVAVLGGAGLWYARSLPKPVTIAQAAPGVAVSSVSPSPSVTLIVDVAGEVEQPGVYEFAEDDRVIDAIKRAGGQLPKADLSLLNLAAPLTDGTQILVPKSGPPGAVVPGGGTAGSSSGLINVNSASAAELETLSGIGEVLAATIIEYREQNGPFASVDELMDVSGIGPATLEEIRDKVTV
jgi:competence protein ComEA